MKRTTEGAVLVEEYGGKLRQLRKDRGITQRDAARSLGISHTRLGDYERGRTHGTKYGAVPKREMLVKMAEVYDHPIENLLGLFGYPPVAPTPVPRPSDDEAMAREIVEIFHKLPTAQKRVFWGVARAFRERSPQDS